MDPVVSSVLQLLLAWILAESALDKVRDRGGFTRTLAAYRLVPGAFLSATVNGLALIEFMLATAIFLAMALPLLGVGSTRLAAVAGLGCAGLLGLYGVAITINLLRGRRDLDCGCGGPAQHHSLGPALVVRNFALVGAALSTTLPLRPRTLTTLDFATTLLAAAALLLARGAIEHLLANGPESARLRAEMSV
jgi:hypothetical protein